MQPSLSMTARFPKDFQEMNWIDFQEAAKKMNGEDND